jgi:hypothetical protein
MESRRPARVDTAPMDDDIDMIARSKTLPSTPHNADFLA